MEGEQARPDFSAVCSAFSPSSIVNYLSVQVIWAESRLLLKIKLLIPRGECKDAVVHSHFHLKGVFASVFQLPLDSFTESFYIFSTLVKVATPTSGHKVFNVVNRSVRNHPFNLVPPFLVCIILLGEWDDVVYLHITEFNLPSAICTTAIVFLIDGSPDFFW